MYLKLPPRMCLFSVSETDWLLLGIGRRVQVIAFVLVSCIVFQYTILPFMLTYFDTDYWLNIIPFNARCTLKFQLESLLNIVIKLVYSYF